MNIYIVCFIIWQCAVYVNGYLPNIECQKIQAHNIETSAGSSQYRPTDLPWYAVDGVRSTDIKKPGCFHSGTGDTTPWWSVTFKVPFKIEGVVITNRQDCCGERLSKITVTVGDEICAEYSLNADVDPGAQLMLKCPRILTGSTLKITRDGHYLTLCEVEIMQPKD